MSLVQVGLQSVVISKIVIVHQYKHLDQCSQACQMLQMNVSRQHDAVCGSCACCLTSMDAYTLPMAPISVGFMTSVAKR